MSTQLCAISYKELVVAEASAMETGRGLWAAPLFPTEPCPAQDGTDKNRRWQARTDEVQSEPGWRVNTRISTWFYDLLLLFNPHSSNEVREKAGLFHHKLTLLLDCYAKDFCYSVTRCRGLHEVLSWQLFIFFECRQADCNAAGVLLQDGSIMQRGYKALVVCHRCPPAKNAQTALLVSHVRLHLTELATYPHPAPPWAIPPLPIQISRVKVMTLLSGLVKDRPEKQPGKKIKKESCWLFSFCFQR